MSERTLEDLRLKQALPLNVKISLTRERIRQWIHEYGEDGVYVSFSGGKDSTVLLDIVRNVCGYTDVPAVFVDVPTQYPELRDFVKTYDNVEILKPKISFMEVCQKYGFPLISKEVSGAVSEARKYLKKCLTNHQNDVTTATDRQTDRQTDRLIFRSAYAIADLLGIERRKPNSRNESAYQSLLMGIIPDEFLAKAPVRLQMLFGKVIHKEKGVATNEYSAMYDKSRYNFFLDADFEISDACCRVMKKTPLHKYAKETGRHPMTAQMADESRLRQSQWIRHGCNAFDSNHPISNPMSFWTEQDVLTYIVKNNIQLCSVYGDVVEDFGNQLDGQMNLGDFGFYEKEKKYKCTGCKRTGCMLCGFGCHNEKSPNRFELLKQTHPGMYKLLDVVKNNGVTMREAIEWTNEHGNLNIKL